MVFFHISLFHNILHTKNRHNKPKGRFFWFVLVSVNRIVIYNY